MVRNPTATPNPNSTPTDSRPRKLLYSLDDAAHILSLSRRSIMYLISQQKLAVRRLGSRVFIHADTLTRFAQSDLDSLTSCATPS